MDNIFCSEKDVNPINTLPLVSVIILTYMSFDHLYETLETVWQQDYPMMEVLISDDGSRHFPEEELRAWISKRTSPGIISTQIHINKKNMGLVAHSNYAASLVHGNIIKFLSPGDGFLHPWAITKLAGKMVDTGENIVTSPSQVCSNDNMQGCYQFPSPKRVRQMQTYTAEDLFCLFLQKNYISAVGTIFSRAFFQNGGFDSAYHNLDDWPTWLQTFCDGKTIPCLSEPLVYYRIGGMSSSKGTAYDSLKLKDDMRLCYERAILPFCDSLSPFGRYRVHFYYQYLLNGCSTRHQVIFFPMRVFYRTKKELKKWLIYLKDRQTMPQRRQIKGKRLSSIFLGKRSVADQNI